MIDADCMISDGRDVLPGEKGPQDACGVFGVWAPGEEVAKLTYFGLYALQHRGQESAGIAVSNGDKILVYKDMGLVAQVFDETALLSLQGSIAVGHCRYSTTGGSTWQNAQPTLGATADGTVALAHNGNLINVRELRELVVARHGEQALGELARGNTTDTALVTALLAGETAGAGPASTGTPVSRGTLEATAREVLPHLEGAFSFVFMDEHTLYAARDPHGIRPLVLGRLERGWVVASETAALDIVGAAVVREVEPGELVAVDSVTPVPESGTPAAVGYAQESGIPYGQGLVKNGYVGRTFIQPSQTIRQLGIRLKLNPLREVIQGQRLVVVDDSIVRGNTQRALVRMLREAGAAEVHVRISSPPVLWPCFYGIDFASRAELMATGLKTDEIRAGIGADSLGYISLDAMVEATRQGRDRLCTACFTGEYPVPLPSPDLLGKHALETPPGAGPAVTDLRA